MTESERLARLETRLENLERQMASSNSIPIAVFDAYTKLRENVESDLARRVAGLEEAQTWAFRLVAASFVGILVEAVIIVVKFSGRA